MKIRITRSRKRRKTVSARLANEVLEIRVPFYLPRREAIRYADLFKKRFQAKEKVKTDRYLSQKANQLAKKYQLKPGKFAIFWSKRQLKIFGTCHHQTKTIRISSRLKKAPGWVLDYVIIHELAHLLHPNHSQSFWRLVNRFPRTEKARGFLLGTTFSSKRSKG